MKASEMISGECNETASCAAPRRSCLERMNGSTCAQRRVQEERERGQEREGELTSERVEIERRPLRVVVGTARRPCEAESEEEVIREHETLEAGG